MVARGKESGAEARILVWDLPTRLFHWLSVALVLGAYVTSRLGWIGWHLLDGEALLAIVLFRLAWGVLGSETARFSSFIATPRAALLHLRHVFRREPDAQIGHNAAGGWMVLLLIALLLGETLDGVLLNNDVSNDGPLTEVLPNWVLNLVANLHLWLWHAIAAAVLLHVIAVGVYGVAKRHRLLRAMVTGRKVMAGAAVAPRIASPVLALVLLGGGIVVAVGLVELL